MASRELIVNDEFCEQMSEYIKKRGKHSQETINSFLAILKDINANGIVDGETKNSLEAYISFVEKLKEINVEDISSNIANRIKSFIASVDEADQFLF